MRPLQFCLFAGVIALCGCSESKDAYTQMRIPHAALISGLESYSSPPAGVRERLPKQLEIKVLFDSKVPVEDPRPRFDELILRVTGFSHLGFVGDLDLQFINDRLASTEFCPLAPAAYRNALRASGVRIENDYEDANSPHPGVLTHVWATYANPNDLIERSCVDWVDDRLLDEQKRWTWRYEL